MNPPSPAPSNLPGSQSDAIGSIIIFIDGPVNNTRRPRPRNIPFMPPDAFDIPPMPEKPKKDPPKDGTDHA